MTQLELRRRFALADPPYPTVPFAVPPGVGEVRVRLAVQPEEAVVDLGLADPCGVRGWSGGARKEVTVTPASATPGYLPGLVRPGKWAVLLGLYRVPKPGCEVRLTVELREGGAGRWYRGDLHAHTHHSDAQGSVADLVSAALGRGLDFLAVTDHNTVAHHRELHDPRLCLIPGQEVTTYRGHYTALGPGPGLEFRHTTAEGVRDSLQAAHALRLLRVLAHPKPTCPSCDWAWGQLEHFDAFEVWNGPWAALNWISRDRWVTALNAGLRLPPVGGSDRHQTRGRPDATPGHLQVGSPTTWVRSPGLSPGDVLTAVLEGRTAVSQGPQGPLVFLERAGGEAAVVVERGAGGLLRVYDERGTRLDRRLEADLERVTVPFGGAAYLRAEVEGAWEEADLAALREAWERFMRPLLAWDELRAQPRVLALSAPLWARPDAALTLPTHHRGDGTTEGELPAPGLPPLPGGPVPPLAD